MNLDEERQGGDQLMDRIDRGREQVQHTHTQELGVVIAALACVTDLFSMCS